MISSDLCYVCGLRPVMKSGRCEKCQAVNRGQREAIKAGEPVKRVVSKSTVVRAMSDAPVYDIKVGN